MSSILELSNSGDSKRRSGRLTLNDQDVRSPSESLENGEVVDLMTDDGEFRGRGFYSENGSPTVRVISESKISIDHTFFNNRLEQARNYRKGVLGNERSFRLVHSDADYLPGLVVDCYGDRVVVQFRHPTIDRLKNKVLDAINRVIDPRSIYARNDFKARESHGLDRYKGLLDGEPIPDRVILQKNPFELLGDLKRGQKTGFYLDQRENRAVFERYVGDGEGLDCFSYSGGWGLHALNAGASSVIFVDRSEEASELLRENLRRNNWTDHAEIITNDAFDVLNKMNESNRSFDFASLDPPAFARRHDQLDDAKRGYVEANLRVMRMVKNNGILATSSCSSPVDRDTFVDIIRRSARDAHTACRVLEERSQPPDHPWLPELPSTRYLTCLICEISLQ